MRSRASAQALCIPARTRSRTSTSTVEQRVMWGGGGRPQAAGGRIAHLVASEEQVEFARLRVHREAAHEQRAHFRRPLVVVRLHLRVPRARRWRRRRRLARRPERVAVRR